MPIRLTQGGSGVRLGGGSVQPREPFINNEQDPNAGGFDADATAQQATESGSGLGGALALGAGGVAGLLALLASRNPGTAGKVAKKVGGGLNELRYGSMLSGFAAPKSALGNIGASVVGSLEHGTAAPLKEFFSLQTVKDWLSALKSGGTVGPAAGQAQSGVRQGSSILNLPGRVIGAGDSATRNALQRAGLTEEEAKRLLLQRDLPPEVADMADSAVGRYMIPFRTTPFNTLREGLETLKFKHPAVTAGAAGAGAAVGATTDDPKTLALTSPLAATYALPYLLGGIAGKYYLRGDSAGKAVQAGSGISPYSDYAMGEMVTNPLRPYSKPAALSALDFLFGE